MLIVETRVQSNYFEMKLSNKNILIASLQPWSSPMLSKHFIALELAKLDNDIVFLGIERILAGLIHNKFMNGFKFNHFKHERIHIKNLQVVPGFLRNSTLLKIAVKILRKTLGSNYYPDIIFAFDPQFYILHEVFSKALKIYYCVDHVASNAVLEEAQVRILSKSDIVIVASQQLYQDFKEKHENVHYVPHGVNLFEEDNDIELKKRIESWFHDKKNKAVFGFLGRINIQIDFKIIDYVARQNPNAIIALIGPKSSEVKDVVAKLPQNVFCPGPVPAIGLKYCLKHFDVGIVPYVMNHYNTRRNPIKIMQYIAGGIPVVTTQIGEDFKQNDFVYQCTNPQEFEKKLVAAYQHNSNMSAKERIRWKKENSWTQRIKSLEEIIDCS